MSRVILACCSLLLACGDPSSSGPHASIDAMPTVRVHVKVEHSAFIIVYDTAGRPLSQPLVSAGGTVTVDVPEGGAIEHRPEPRLSWPHEPILVAGIRGPGERSMDFSNPYRAGSADDVGSMLIRVTDAPAGTHGMRSAAVCGNGASGTELSSWIDVLSPPCTGSAVTVAMPGRMFVAQDAAQLRLGDWVDSPSSWAAFPRRETKLVGVPAEGETTYHAALFSGDHLLVHQDAQPVATPSGAVTTEYLPGHGLSLVERARTEVIANSLIVRSTTVAWNRPAEAVTEQADERTVETLPHIALPTLLGERTLTWTWDGSRADADYAVFDQVWTIVALPGTSSVRIPDAWSIDIWGAPFTASVFDVDTDSDHVDGELAITSPAWAASLEDLLREDDRYQRFRPPAGRTRVTTRTGTLR